MIKPKDFDTALEFGELPPLEPGGHILKILKVEETKSRNDADMLVIYFDTDGSDKQPGYFKKRFDSDNRDNKSWGGRAWQLVYDKDGNTNPSFKSFITSIEKSNNAAVVWGDGFCKFFENKLVGGVFRREQFLTDKGKTAFAVKCMAFRSVETIKAGIEPPEDKLLENTSTGGYSATPFNTAQLSTAAVAASAADDDYPF